MKTLVAAGISADEICAVIDAENADDVKDGRRDSQSFPTMRGKSRKVASAT